MHKGTLPQFFVPACLPPTPLHCPCACGYACTYKTLQKKKKHSHCGAVQGAAVTVLFVRCFTKMQVCKRVRHSPIQESVT